MRRITVCSMIALQLILALATAQAGWAVETKKPSDLEYVPVEGVTEEDTYYGVFQVPNDGWRRADVSERYGPIEGYREDVSRLGLVNSIERLSIQVRGSGTFDEEPNGERLREALLDTLAGLAHRLGEPAAVPMSNISQGFLATTGAADLGMVVYEPVFFKGTGKQIVLRETPMKQGSIAGAPVRDKDKPRLYYASVDQAIEVRTVCAIMEDMFAEVREGPYDRVTARLAAIDRGWENYIESGYSQYPWEVVLNSHVTPRVFGEFSWYDPPDEQLVLLHPELCVLVDTRSREEASAESAVLVHGLGYIHYFGDERDWFLGLSASISLSNEDTSLAYGPTLHFDHAALGSRMPHVSVSLLWYDVEEESDSPIVAVAVDFWRLLSGGGAEGLFRSAPE